MNISELLFIIFGVAAIFAGILVISSNNPIHSIFSLVLAFANISFIMILLGVEFLGILFLIVYVGAIAILFLFVIMMLNIKLVELLDNATRYLPIGMIIGVFLLIEMTILLQNIFPNVSSTINLVYAFQYTNIINFTNLFALGQVLYQEFSVYIIIASVILLVAMLAGIILTLTHEDSVKRQDLFTQIATDYHHTVKLIK
jgi:NADH-quinone oxidoreductase subunit J